MKVGDIVYHKTNPTMPMVVTILPSDKTTLYSDGVTCRWWNPTLREYKEDVFDLKELLFDGEQQQKTYIPKGDEAGDGKREDIQ